MRNLSHLSKRDLLKIVLNKNTIKTQIIVLLTLGAITTIQSFFMYMVFNFIEEKNINLLFELLIIFGSIFLINLSKGVDISEIYQCISKKRLVLKDVHKIHRQKPITFSQNR